MDKKAGHMMMGMMDDDAYMLCKVLDSVAGQAIELKKKIKMGKKLPSWAEYKVYKAGDSIKSAMSSTFSIRDHMPRISIAIKSAPPMGSVLPSNMKKVAFPSAAKRTAFRSFSNTPKPPPTPEESGRSQASTNAARRARLVPKAPMTDTLRKKWTGPGTAFYMAGAAKTRNTGGWSFPSTVAGTRAREFYEAKMKKPKVTGAPKPPSYMRPRTPPQPSIPRPPVPGAMRKEGMMGNSPFTQQMMKGMPGYSKGGPVKKDGYLTDKKGKPYARVHKGEKVVPKDEKTKKAWAKLAMIGDPTIAPVRNIGTNNSVSTSAPKVKAPKATPTKDNSRGLSYFNSKTFPLFDSKGNRTISTGNVNKKNYKLRASEALTNKSPYAGKGLDYIRAAQRGAGSVTKVRAPKATSGM